jgi:hypothetical protein
MRTLLYIALFLIATDASAVCYDARGYVVPCQQSTNTFSTTGQYGNRVNIYRDNYGNTTGTIGRDRVNIYQDKYGNTTGTIGNRRIHCYTDRYGNTTCN